MAYKRLTDAYIDIVEGKTDEASIDLLRKKLRKVKGITKDQIAVLSTMPTPVLTSVINQLSLLVSSKEEDVKENVTFAGHNSYVGASDTDNPLDEKLVASDMSILDAILNKIKDDVMKNKLAGKFEKSWPMMQQLAKLAGWGITKKGQQKNKSYTWKLKK